MTTSNLPDQDVMLATLRYLGYQGKEPDPQTEDLLNELFLELAELKEERFIYRCFDLSSASTHVNVANDFFKLPGESIKKHLENSTNCILMAVTLGHQVDKRLRYYEKLDLSKALILDACATAACEDLANRVCLKIEEDFSGKGQQLTGRFSPGYGDLPIELQADFIQILDAHRKLGLTVTSSSILIPRKSITAVMGIVAGDLKQKENNCLRCKRNFSCNFRKKEN